MVENLPEADWRRVIDVNLTGAFLCCQAVLPIMRRNGYGKIINISSIASKRISYNAGAHYTASKEGLLGFTRHLAYEVAPYGINVNAVCPGPTLTPLVDHIVAPETLREREKKVPRGRLVTPEDIARAVLFLISDWADLVCGVALDVDGGDLLGWFDVETYRLRRQQQ
jgi:NAD(P)-dependent dehydrogenase (short-subunit alcohol dehydrogenase family)